LVYDESEMNIKHPPSSSMRLSINYDGVDIISAIFAGFPRA
jgi:hypothetical protein